MTNLQEYPTRVIHETIVENLKAANAAEKMGEKDDAKYYLTHASELTLEIISRGFPV